MDTIWHGTVGSMMFMLPLRVLGVSNEIALSVTGSMGFTVGAAPDAVGDLEPEPSNEQKRWNWYNDCHWNGDVCKWMKARWYWLFTLPWVFHAWVDTFFHDTPVFDQGGSVLIRGTRWWIWNERLPHWAGLWVATIGALYLMFAKL